MYATAGKRLMSGAVFIVTVILLLSAGCTGTPASHTAPRRSYSPGTTVLIGSAGANPPVLVVDKGITVTWLDTDTGYYTITSDDNDPDSFESPPLAYNEEFQWTFTLPGTYSFHCPEDSAIKGTIIVNA